VRILEGHEVDSGTLGSEDRLEPLLARHEPGAVERRGHGQMSAFGQFQSK
jgi:hypothetical protein